MIGWLFKAHQICAGWYRRCLHGLAVTVETNLLEVRRSRSRQAVNGIAM
jgi:hypothetical protein